MSDAAEKQTDLRESFNIASLSKLRLSEMRLSEIIDSVANDNVPPGSKKQLRPAFNTAAARQELLERQPALMFEERTGLHGIAGQYSYPDKVMPFDLEDTLLMLPLQSEVLPLLNNLWQRMEELNPVLKQVSLRREDPRDMYYALMGVTSGFNVDDINFFLETDRRGRAPYAYAISVPEIKQLYEDIESRAGRMSWVAAPATLKKIKSKLDKKPAPSKPRP